MASREIRRSTGQKRGRKESRQVARHKTPPKPRNKQVMMTYAIIAAMCVVAAAVIFWPPNLGKPTVVRVETDKGAFVMHLYSKMMPITVANLVRLATDGFYDGLTFHRVEDWVVQGGDPAGDGTGGPGWTIQFESSRHLKHSKYAVGMARNQLDVNSAGSQFYIVKSDADFLDGSYACFGKVVEGFEVIDQIEEGDVMISVTIVSQP